MLSDLINVHYILRWINLVRNPTERPHVPYLICYSGFIVYIVIFVMGIMLSVSIVMRPYQLLLAIDLSVVNEPYLPTNHPLLARHVSMHGQYTLVHPANYYHIL